MREFRNRVAVVTGAASGIGRGIARRCAQEGMKVVLADIEGPALDEAARELQNGGHPVISVITDVSKAGDIEALANRALDEFGAVHLLVNNAGVGVVRASWEHTLLDWQWVLGVNLWGVIYGVRTFVPIMLAQDTDCHVVNVSSISGLIVGPGSSASYNVSKHGVVSLSETLYYDLALRRSKVHVSVVFPYFVDTRIFDAARNRPQALRNDPDLERALPQDEATIAAGRQSAREGMSPDQAAEIIFGAIRDERLYVFTHPETKEWVRQCMEGLIAEANPPLFDA
ncbi:MAG: SDR family NAD(P)-dependent oxidoreductase [Caldilineaceae bacterium]